MAQGERKTGGIAAMAVTLGIAMAGQATAGPFDGRFRPAPTSDCTAVGTEGGAIGIDSDTFTGVEASCAMTRPVNVRDMDATLYDMECSGKDTEWTRRAMLMNAPDGGLILIWDGFAFKYDRCPADPAAGTVTTADDIGVPTQ